MLRSARDSFLHLINDNLPTGSGAIPCHAIRRDPNSRSSDALQMNAVNVEFLNISGGDGTVLCSQQVAIDIVNDDENTCVDWVGTVMTMLRAAFYAPVLDYSNPTAPASTGTNMKWDRKRVTFKRVSCETYCHYSCLLSLKFTSQ